MTAAGRRQLIEQVATELFAQGGYHGVAMEEIAARAGVSVPVVYDHFPSKEALHRRLLERHFEELRAVWRTTLPGDLPAAERLERAFGAWFYYVESHPYAWRMLFRDTDGEPGADVVRREVAEESKSLLMPLLAQEPGVENVAGRSASSLELVWTSTRSLLQGLAVWWYDHPEVPRAQLVRTAMNLLWLGFERVREGETWRHP